MFLLIPAVPTVDEHFLRIKTDSHILDRAVHPHLFLAEPDLDQNFFSMRIQLLFKCGSGLKKLCDITSIVDPHGSGTFALIRNY